MSSIYSQGVQGFYLLEHRIQPGFGRDTSQLHQAPLVAEVNECFEPVDVVRAALRDADGANVDRRIRRPVGLVR